MTDSNPDPTSDEAQEARIRRIAGSQPPFAHTLGFRLVSFGLEEVVAELDVTPELGNRNGVLHGGAIMAFADNLGGTSASIHLPDSASTTTLESKTNFFRAVRVGTTARGICVPLHVGRSTSVWQTSIRDQHDRLAALVTQTQLTMHPPGPADRR